MSLLVTVLARADSRGLPGKAMMDLHGKPLIAHTLDMAVKYGDVVLSTNDEEVLDFVAEQSEYVDVLVVERSDDMATNTTPKMESIKDALGFACSNGTNYDTVLDLDVTAPLRTEDDVDKCLDIFMNGDYNTVFSVVKSRKSPDFNMVEMAADNPRYIRISDVIRRQDTLYTYDMNASIYVYDADWLLKDVTNRPVSARSKIYVMEDWQAFDIDTIVDFYIVETMMEKFMVRVEK